MFRRKGKDTGGSDPDAAWPLVEQWMGQAKNPYRFTPAEPAEGQAVLDALEGISERSPLGALALHSTALVIDD